jgi:thiamine pyrophosphate-dependent acetolactate synthase large subunit-like protein
LRPEVAERLKTADVILALDWIDLAGALSTVWPGGSCPAFVINATLDHQLHNGWSFDHFGLPPTDLRLAAEPDAVVAALIAALPAQSRELPMPMPARAADVPSSGVITIATLAARLQEATRGEAVSLLHLPLGWDGGYWPFRHPLDYIGGDGGAGIGGGPGIAVGAALALEGSGRLPIAITGDGDFLMSASALWTAVHYKIPVMIVLANNRSFFNDELHQERMARQRSRPVENRWVGQRIAEPAPDLAQIARAHGAIGIGPVRDAADLTAALDDGVRALRGGAVVVIDVHVAPGYAPGAAMTRESGKAGHGPTIGAVN